MKNSAKLHQVLFARDRLIRSMNSALLKAEGQKSLIETTGAKVRSLTGELESLRSQFVSSEKDREARGRVIEEQGKRIGELEGEVHQRLKEIKGLFEERDKLGQQSQALAQELESLRSQFVSSEKDREARGRVIEEQGKRIGELEEKTLRQKEELIRASQKLIKISEECASLLAKIKIILIVANPLVALVGRALIKGLEAKIDEVKKVLRLS